MALYGRPGSRAGQHERVGDDERYSGRVIKVPGAGECTEDDRTGQEPRPGMGGICTRVGRPSSIRRVREHAVFCLIVLERVQGPWGRAVGV